MNCAECKTEFDPAKDEFVTVHERKGPSRNFCTLKCAETYVRDED